MLDIVREAPLGQAIRFLSRNKILQYPEERPDFQIPAQYIALLEGSEKPADRGSLPVKEEVNPGEIDDSSSLRSQSTVERARDDLEALEQIRTFKSIRTAPYTNERLQAERTLEIERTKSLPVVPQKTTDGIVLVDWYTTDDPANPQNWSSFKRGWVVFVISLYTWVVYCAGPLFAPAEEGIIQHFRVSPTAASLGLSLYVLAYGIGDLVFAPLSEIPIVGRNPVYFLTFLIYWVLSFPTAVVGNFGGLLVLRFLQGFFGSPALANGGATIGDMYALIYIPYGLCWWVYSAWGGPAIGPLIGGFAAMAEGWRWPLWETVWMSSPVILILLCLMPETSASTILLRRANRLRKLMDTQKLQSQSEIDQRNLTASSVLIAALVRPIEIMLKDPAILFVNVYTGYFYGVFYTFFEVFPLVFPPFYGFNLGQTGLTFLSCTVGATIGILGFFAYLYWYMVPDNVNHGLREQEHRLIPAIVGSFFLPVGLFIFAWTSDTNIHWVVPLIGVVIFVLGEFWILQALFVYIPFSYPKYAASLFAGNSIFRSGTACASILFARPLFINMGVHKGVTLLAGLSVGGVVGMIVLYMFGKKLRAKSKFAQS